MSQAALAAPHDTLFPSSTDHPNYHSSYLLNHEPITTTTTTAIFSSESHIFPSASLLPPHSSVSTPSFPSSSTSSFSSPISSWAPIIDITEAGSVLLDPDSVMSEERVQGLHPSGEEDWNRLARLLMLSTLAAVGTIGNIFAISAVMTEDHLKKKGNVLLVNLMLAGLVVTGAVLPAGVVTLLAGWAAPFPPAVCAASWALTSLAAHTTLVTLPALAWENWTRLQGKPMSSPLLAALVALAWALGAAITATQYGLGLAPNHCGTPRPMLSFIHTVFTASVGVALVFTPIIIAIALHIRTLVVTRRPQRGNTSVKPSPNVTRDLALATTNLAVTVVVGLCWSAGVAADWWASLGVRSSLVWLSTAAATGVSLLYAAHRPFREAYFQLFNYCCCKTSVSLSRRNGRAEAIAAVPVASTRPASDVRVHIIPGYNMYNATTREHRPLPHTHHSKPPRKPQPRPKLVNRKDVYEL